MSQDDEIDRINKKKLEEMLQKSKDPRAGPMATAGGAKPIELTDGSFSSEVKKHPIMVVDFWAPWCGPCRMVGPIIEQLASEYSGRVTFGKLNVDDNPMVSSRFGVQSIPTILVFRNGEAVDGLLGAVPKAYIEEKFKKYLNAADVASSSSSSSSSSSVYN